MNLPLSSLQMDQFSCAQELPFMPGIQAKRECCLLGRCPVPWLGAWLDRRGVVASLFAALVVAATAPAARADGGVPLAVRSVGGYRVGVFAEPAPLRAGPVDISVMVQGAESREYLRDVTAWVTVQSEGPVVVRRTAEATEDAATNKLFRAALLELPFSGRWTVAVAIEGMHGKAELAVDVIAGDPLPRWQRLWGWFTWPIIPIGLFLLHQYLAARQEQARQLRPR